MKMAEPYVEFGDLQSELEKAKESLKSVDENIKKLTGRDPTEVRAQSQQRRNAGIGLGGGGGGGPEFRVRGLITGVDRRRESLNDGPSPGRRRPLGPLHGRLGIYGKRVRDDDSGDEDMARRPTLQSSVVVTPMEQKTRKDCIEEQKTDAKGMARNRRMFGLLLGTLQKFRVESQQKHDKDQKRIEIERKLEAIAEKEKEELRKERQELFQERRRRQAELRRLEYKLDMVKQHEEWEKHYQQLQNFIRTKTKPHVFYLPRRHGQTSEKRLAETRQELEAVIADKRQRMEEDVAALGKRREVATEEGVLEGASRENAAGGSVESVGRRKRRRTEKNGNGDWNDDEDDESDEDGEVRGEAAIGEARVGDDVAADGEGPVRTGEEGPATAPRAVRGGSSGSVEDATEEAGEAMEVPADGDAKVADDDDQAPFASVVAAAAADILDPTNLAEKEFEPIYD